MKFDMKTGMKAVLAIAVFSGSFYLMNGILRHSGYLSRFQHPAVGMAVPSLKLEDIDGQEVDLAELIKGKKAVLFFWSSTCAHCVKQLRDQEALKQQMESGGIEYMLINSFEESGRIRRFLEKMSSRTPCYMDPGGLLASALKVTGVPAYYFIDEKGIVVKAAHELTGEMIRDFAVTDPE
jgi:peroxiredoxin